MLLGCVVCWVLACLGRQAGQREQKKRDAHDTLLSPSSQKKHKRTNAKTRQVDTEGFAEAMAAQRRRSKDSREEVDLIRSACRVVAEVLVRLREAVAPGISTWDLDRMAEEWTRNAGAVPAFKGYNVAGRVYPSALCASINEEVVHGMPSPRRLLKEGDIIGLDFGVVRKGYYGDAAVTVGVGRVSEAAVKLMDVTSDSLQKGIENVRLGNRIRDVSRAIQEHAEAHGFGVVPT